MKTLILTALMGTTMVHVNANETTTADRLTPTTITVDMPVAIDQATQAFMDQVGLHQWHVEIVWQQYDQLVENIQSKRGSVSDLQTQMNSLIKYYQDDIEQGIRIDDSNKAIAEIRAMYSKKIEKQAKAEAKEIARLQALLGREVEREEGEFNALKAAHADHINVHTEARVRATERQFTHSALRMQELNNRASLAAR